MAVQAIVTRTGRRLYKDARGKFISKAKYQLEQRRGPGGRFLSQQGAQRYRNMETYLRGELGAPPAGKSWAQIASKYPERFESYLDDVR